MDQQQQRPDDGPSPFTPTQIPLLVCEAFDGIDTSTSRFGVKPEQLAWSDGFFQVGPALFRTLPDVGGALWTAHPDTGGIAFFGFSNIAATPYCVVVTNDGAVRVINQISQTVTVVGPPGTVQTPAANQIAISSFGAEYIIIVANQLNGYFIYDGVFLFKPGEVAPGGGFMPTGIGGSAVETFAGRVWVARGATIFFTAPGSAIDFSTGNGGGDFSSTDSFLRVRYVSLKQTNGFLYLIADSSVNYISGVQTSGSPPITTFTNQNVDPETGTPYSNTVVPYGRNIVFANSFGVHLLYGAAATKISDDLDGVYTTIPGFGGFEPTAGKAIIYGKKTWVLLLPIIDPITQDPVKKLFLWNGKKWFPASQSMDIIELSFQEIDSFIIAWATDGVQIRPLFQTPSDRYQKLLRTKFWAQPVDYRNLKTANRIWGLAQYYLPDSPFLDITVDNEYGSSPEPDTFGPDNIQWADVNGNDVDWVDVYNDIVLWLNNSQGPIVFRPTAVGQKGVILGMTVRTNAADVAVVSLALGADAFSYRG